MYVRIYWGKIHPRSWEDLKKNYEKLMELPTPGLIGRMVMRDTVDSESIYTITMWKDVESVTAWEKSEEYKTLYVAAVSAHILGSRSVSLCEVKVENLTRHFKPGVIDAI